MCQRLQKNNLGRSMLVYLCNAIDEESKTQRGINTDSPAATRKVILISQSIVLAGLDVTILSLARGRQNGSWHLFSSNEQKLGELKTVSSAFLHAPLITHIVSALSMLLLFARLRKQGAKKVLAYNRCWHYLPTLFYAKAAVSAVFLIWRMGGFKPQALVKNC